MASNDVKNLAGHNTGTVDLDDAIFGIEPNLAVMHQVVTAQLAAKRSGTPSTKTRAEVRGGGAKPWKQKGTGRARQGSLRSPQWRGGGVDRKSVGSGKRVSGRVDLGGRRLITKK